KPILQIIYESLYQYNIRDFCFIVGRTKRAVKDHFTPDYEFANFLKKEKKDNLTEVLYDFFLKLKKSNMTFIYQPKPIGFGNAIYSSRKFVGKDTFLLHAGDDIVISKNNDHLRRLESKFKKYRADIAFLIEQVADPSQYGVIKGKVLEKGIIEVKEMEEKPKRPTSKYAIIAIYMFKPTIFQYLSEAEKLVHPEKQLASAFNIAIRNGAKMIGVMLKKSEKRMDVGTPETYLKVLRSLHGRQ
ncbi:MAG: hypothetical protein E6G55_08300, partial [Actinobacteria bacterium]